MMNFPAVNHLVANAGIWSSCFFEEITNITAFHNVIVRKTIFFMTKYCTV